MKALLFALKPPLSALGLLGICVLLRWYFPAFRWPGAPFPWIGVFLCALGLLLLLWGFFEFKRKKNPVRPEAQPLTLIITGPYRFTRNPMYSGIFITLCGIALGLGSIFLLAAPLLFFMHVNFIFVPFEEARLVAAFGDEYGAYRSRVRRWL